MKRFGGSLLTIISLIVFTSILTSGIMPSRVEAAVDAKNPNEVMADLTEKWLYYRAITGCYSVQDVGKNSKEDVQDFKWLRNNQIYEKTSLGYLGGSDGVVDCGDKEFLQTGHSRIFSEWSDGVKAFCAVQGAAKSNGGGDEAGCRDGSKDFDMSGNESEQAEDFKSAKANHAADSADYPYDPKGEMWYYLYRRTLEYFCGGDKRMYDSAAQASSTGESDSVRQVVYVEGLTGEKKTLYYKLGGDKDKDTEIEKIYALTGKTRTGYGGNSGANFREHKCSTIADKTQDHAEDYSKWAWKRLNGYAKASLLEQVDMGNVSEYLERVCGDRPAGGGIRGGVQDEGSTQSQCQNAQYNSITQAIEECSGIPAVLKGEAGLDVDKRFELMRECVLGKIPAQLADALGNAAPTQSEKDDQANSSEDQSSCTVEGIGWLICPVMNFMAELNDQAFGFLSDSFLVIDPELLTGDTKTAWGAFRDLANALFVIGFLIIIYSQITGAGISNYGIKKMMPKLILVAVLVNVSYYLCLIAVDISNIVGNQLAAFLGTGIPVVDGDTATTGNTDLPLWKDVAGGLLVGAAIGVGLVLLIAIGLPILLAFAMIVIILIARKALIILLVAVSPIAFVAYLLPNTESIYKKWWSIFKSLLILYPIIGLVFGASMLAAKIIASSDDPIVQLTALGVAGLPLFAVPVLLKGALSATGQLGNKLAGMQDRANRYASNKGKQRYKDSAFAQGMANRKDLKAKFKQNKLADAIADPSKASRYNRMRARMSRGVTGRSFSDAGDYAARQAQASAVAVANKNANEAVEHEEALLSGENADGLLAIAMNRSHSSEKRAAALRKLEGVGGHQHIQKAYDYLAKEGAKTGSDRDADISDIQQLSAASLLKRKPAGVKSSVAKSMQTGTMSGSGYMDMLQSRINNGELGAEDYAKMDKDDLIRVAELSQSGQINGAQFNKIISDIEGNESLKGTMNAERKRLFENAARSQAPQTAAGGTRNPNPRAGYTSSGGLIDL